METQESTGTKNRTEGCVYPTPWGVIEAKWYTQKRLEETPTERERGLTTEGGEEDRDRAGL